MFFDWNCLTIDDRYLAAEILGSPDVMRQPDLCIAPDGYPYLWRWWVIPKNRFANIYLHVQVADDPERPLHDHPWHNQSVILSGGYVEKIQAYPPAGPCFTHMRSRGETIHRKAHEAHRLFLPERIPYTMTLFTTGPKCHDWGFWHDNIFTPHKECVEDLPDGRSLFKEELLRK